jgi:diketogulonate reductase-like aldo/keto reductase
MKRRQCLINLSAVGLLPLASSWLQMKQPINKRIIPSTGEQIPVIGLGTWQTFDVSDGDSGREPLKAVLQNLVESGGRVVDSSPMYGRSEDAVGDLTAELGLNDKVFMATKVWTTGKESGIEQMNDSFRLLKRSQMDLMQVHNLTDWQTHLKTLYEWKAEKRIRYIGLTHYTDSAHDRLADIIRKEKIDFIQVNFNLLDRHAEKSLLPLAQEKKVAVLVNRPFEEGALFQRVKGKTLPAWAAEFDCKSWGQFFLKFILSNPSVTCVIPGTSKPHHMLDNLGAGIGKLPDQKHREQMIRFISA